MTARERLPDRRYHESLVFEHEGQHYAAGVGFYEDGRAADLLADHT